MFDMDTLLQNISDEAPSGEDLEYDSDFNALEMANKPGEERVIGDSVIPAEDPDFEQVVQLASALLGRTKDLRVAAMLANAVLRTNGLPAFRDVLRYISDCVETHWETVHPQLDEDDDDPTMRVNAVLRLADQSAVLSTLRQTPLVESRAFGAFCLRDLEIAAGEVAASADQETALNTQTIAAAFQDAGSDSVEKTRETINELLEIAKAISDAFEMRVGAAGPDLEPLQKMVFDIKRRLASFGGETKIEADTPATSDDAAPRMPATTSVGVGAITTPQDVKRALDRIMEYYARFEPSSPLPLLLGRAKRLVSADFVTIMRDMAPEGVGNVALIGGFDPEPEDQYED